MVKWSTPFPGACKQVVVNGNRYVIMNEKPDEYYLARYQDNKQDVRTFYTWRALYKFITGHKPTTRDGRQTIDENIIYNMILTVTRDTGLNSYRTFNRSGAEWVLYEPAKRIARLILPEKISRTFYRESDAVKWATDYLERLKGEKQLTVFDAI